MTNRHGHELAALPPTPDIRLNWRAHWPKPTESTFLHVTQTEISLRYPDGSASSPGVYDTVIRQPIDGAAIVAYFDDDSGLRHVYLRSSIRPAIELRGAHYSHYRNWSHRAVLWELPAGFVELGEQPSHAAARELGEELGFDAPPSDMQPLGGWTFLNPSVLAEQLWFFAIRVDPTSRRTPSEDGSDLERHAAIITLPLDDALEHCQHSHICDAKTELGLMRLARARP